MARASPRAKIPFRGRSAPKRMTYTALARSSREEYRALIAGLRCPSGELLTDLKEQCPKCHSPHVEFKYFDNPPKRTQPRFTCNNPECKVVKFTLGGKQYNPKRGPGPDPEPSEVPGGGEEQSFTTRSSKRTRLSADTGYLHEPAGGAEEVLDSAESKSNAAHQCNYCFDDVSGTFRIECHECPDCELCIECFSINVEITRHKSSHSYQAINVGTQAF
uniref:ZZ-type domain-containing protein n=1 Tax=Physcomitrium patens TaxID=3218 RepID=A0A2K1K0D3_PHYPA|nr:hypothetical protein PHYPA_014352 [Physcomitrium patens]